MYKRTQDNHDYLKRVGSHATKGSRTGIVPACEIVPEETGDPEAVKSIVIKQIRQNTSILEEIENQIIALRDIIGRSNSQSRSLLHRLKELKLTRTDLIKDTIARKAQYRGEWKLKNPPSEPVAFEYQPWSKSAG